MPLVQKLLTALAGLLCALLVASLVSCSAFWITDRLLL